MRPLSALFIVLGLSAGLLVGCEGPPGIDGIDGVDGVDGEDGEDGEDGVDGLDGVDGEDGQDTTVPPADATGLSLTFDGLASTDNGDATYDVVLTFTIKKDGVPYIDATGLPNLDQKRFYTVEYDATTGTFDNSKSFSAASITLVDGNSGQYTITASGAKYAPESSNAQVYGYVADDALDIEAPAGSHVHLYDYVASDALAFGTAVTDPYESPANVEGCESCHGTPYMKHGYRVAKLDGLGDFAACKSCHYDTRSGGHEDWQILVDDPLRYTEIHAGDPLTTAEETYYAYTANLMNDVHMAHSMEFPYPQRMSNCVTCHEGKLDAVLVDENFTAETCRSCHVPTGSDTYGTAEHSLKTIWEKAGVGSLHDIDSDCASCHNADGVGKNVLLKDLHNGGYDTMIYTSDGTRYSDAIVITIDSASFNSTTYELTTNVTITEAIDVDGIDVTDVEPDVRVAMYAFEGKDFYAYESTSETDNGGGSWTATVDLSDYAADITSDMLRRVEIVVRPGVSLVVGDPDVDDGTCGGTCGRGTYCKSTVCYPDDDIGLAPTAPSRTFDLATSSFADGYYADIVDIEKCNSCHDTLATTFHSPNRSGNIAVCRMCHNPTRAGSHLEMQSRSLDSYVHAVHSFQPFDLDEVDFTDPVEAVRYEMHIRHRFPNFTIKNCEGCHNPGMYEVPDQSVTLPGVLSASYDVAGRDIKGVDAKVVGPGARACGACHRAHYINEDDFNGLVSFNRHVQLNGYSIGYEGMASWSTALNSVMWYFGEDTEPDPNVGPETCAVCHKGQGAEHQLIYNDYINPE